MTGATRAQKVRLGIFLIVAGAIVGGTVIGMIGLAAFEIRDEYTIYFDGSVSGLSPGSPVKYNGIDVGRVERVRIAPKTIGRVEVTISLAHNTPVPTDAVAQLNMQGITGLKFIEITGGTKEAGFARPGDSIESSRSTLDDLTERATAIAAKVETLLDQLVETTGKENQRRLASILDKVDLVLADVASISKNVDIVLSENRGTVTSIVGKVDEAISDARRVMDDLRVTLSAATIAVDRAGNWVDPQDVKGLVSSVRTTLGNIDTASATLDRTLDTARARLGKDELGKTIASVTNLSDRTTKFVDNADVTLIRAREDILRALDVLIEGVEAFGELATLLRDDPAALIRGRGGKERKVP